MDIDVVILTRDASPLRPDVTRGIDLQGDVRLRVHRVVGTPRPEDANRWETIARARNEGKRRGSSPWLMFLDDDVVLGPGCVARLVQGLRERPGFAALAADYLRDMAARGQNPDYPRHVAMGATLFRREALDRITFRWQAGRCECRCCCEDLRRHGKAVGYLAAATARHVPSPPSVAAIPRPPTETPERRGPVRSLPGRVLAAFDRRHHRLFRRRFLASLRASGNPESVSAVTYELLPGEREMLSRMPGVEVHAARRDKHPAIRRLRDFQAVIEGWPDDTPVAHWDAGDVIFQGRLSPLWDLVRDDPDRLLVCLEDWYCRAGTTNLRWVETIRDPEARRRALDLLADRRVINAGFVAGTAGAMRRYFRETDRILHSSATDGSTDWSEQTSTNLYFRANPDAWMAIPEGWNYCLCGRDARHYRIRPDGRFERLDGEPLQVVHGNAGWIQWLDAAHLRGEGSFATSRRA